MIDKRRPRPASPAVNASRSGRSAAPAQVERPWEFLIWGGFALHAVVLFFIVLSMTAMTHNLDDIKVSQYFIFGPALAIMALVLIGTRVVPLPPKPVAIGLVGYFAVTVISALLSKYHWIGNYYIQFNWIMIGFFLSAMAIACYRRTAEYFLRFMVVLWLTVNVVGMFMYNVTGGGSGVKWLCDFIYPNGLYGEPTNLYRLLMTLSHAQSDMQSTILSRDFYAGICLLYVPFPLLLTLDPGPSRRPNLWRGIGIVGTMLNLLSIFYCMSKGEYIFAIIGLAFFVVMFFFFGKVRDIERRHMVALIVGMAILIASQIWFRSPTILGQLKGVKTSWESREIMWSAAWQMFKEDPVLGVGPGAFRVYFPEFRRPDYFSHEISHVTTYSHNLIMDTLAETGIAGFAMLMLILCAVWFGGLYWAVRHPDPRLRNILIACLTGVMSFMGSNMSSPNARWVIGTVNLWTVLGFMTGIILLARVRDVEQPVSAMEGKPWEPFNADQLKWVTYCLLGIGAIMYYFAAGTGSRYWVASVSYADGLQSMEPAMDAIDRGSINRETVRRLLEESIEPLEKSIKQEKYMISSYYKLGSVYTTLFNIYRQTADEIGPKDPRGASQYIESSYHFIQLAKERYDQLQAICPDYAQIHYNLGIVFNFYAQYLLEKAGKEPSKDVQQSLVAQAEDLVKKGLDEMKKNARQSDTVEAFLGLGNQYMTLNQPKEATEVFAAAAAKYPANEQAAQGYLQAADASKDRRGVALAWELIWKQNRNDDGVLNTLLQYAFMNKIDDVLTRTLDQMEKMNPADPRIFEYRMQLANRVKNPKEELRLIDMYRRAGGEGLQFYTMAYVAAQNLGDTAKADLLAGEIRQRHGTVPTSPTTPAEAAPASKPADRTVR
ncbi:O-antigen ligase family protein [bacterium]|nr:O-antigen ligase family protein [bacterium]